MCKYIKSIQGTVDYDDDKSSFYSYCLGVLLDIRYIQQHNRHRERSGSRFDSEVTGEDNGWNVLCIRLSIAVIQFPSCSYKM